MPGKFYSIKARANAAGSKSAEIFIYGDIGESWFGESVTAAEFVKEIAALEADEITVRINSYGGSVTDGIAIYNAILRHPAAVTVEIDGIAASIASLIAMAGDTVNIAENALLMVHAPWGGMHGNAAEMRQYADLLDKYADAMTSSYARKTGQDIDTIQALLKDGADHWYDAAEAVAFGFADGTTAAMPIAAAFDLSRYGSLPVAAGVFSRGGIIGSEITYPASPIAAAAALTAKEQHMPTPANPAATEPANKPNESEIAAAAVKADGQRRKDIGTAFASFVERKVEGAAELMAACQEDTACSADEAGKKLLAHLGKSAQPIAGNYVATTEDETDKRRAGISQAILARAAVPGAKVDASNPWRGHKLLDLARASLSRAGIKTDGMGQMEIVAAAFTQSTSDFPVLLENTMHKALQAAYAAQSDTWTRFCAVGSVSDFRAHNRYHLGSFGSLDAKNELGEFKNKTIPDGEKQSITAASKGNIINLSREAIINDDLGAFVGLAAMLGRAAKRTIEVDVYALLAQNSGLGPTMSDGNTLFYARTVTGTNIGTGAALSMAAIDADRVVMASQLDISGNEYLDLRPAVLLVPLSLGGTARSINDAQYDPDTANKLQKPNVVNGLFRDIVDTPRLSGTRRYLFADPSEAPVIEVAFLDGVQDPYLEMQNGFDVDGTEYKVRLDYAVGAVGYQGAVTNAGA